jgi:hypothetical protein
MRKSIIAAMLGAMLALPVAASPAAAGGGFSIQLSPTGETADLVRMGLGVYSMIEGRKNNGKIRQDGRGNGAAIAQGGRGNYGFIDQDGDGHSAVLDQRGRGNAFGVIQSGKRTNAHVVQRGNGGVGLLFQHGW